VTNPPVRVLWLIKGLGAGGAERLVLHSAQRRDRNVVDPRVAYLLRHKSALLPELEQADIAASCLGARASWDPRWIVGLRRLCRAERFDVVHSHSPITTIGARIALRSLPRRVRPRLVTTEHNVWDSHATATRRADAATARGDEIHLAVSEAVRDSMPERLRAKTRVIQYGVDVEAVQAAAPGREAGRRALGVGPDEVLIGTVANLRATKGYPDLLVAAAKVLANGSPNASDVRFVALGQGPMEQELREQAARLGLGDRFRFLGYRPDAVEVMAAFDIFCLPSLHEGLPVALMEALVLGIPVVATDVGGTGEIVTDGRDAVLVPPGDPERLAAALIALVGDPERRRRIGAAGRTRGEDLDVGRAIREVEAVYREGGGR
jgi:glycosyltransferase involved in cell wall biosynthesis